MNKIYIMNDSDYINVVSVSLTELKNHVKQKLKLGYEPIGGVVLDETKLFIQTMYKKPTIITSSLNEKR